MYLKSIEVNGFKSFANRMIFKFDKGITGIVGPNGSGKSNVADAVRWVLGEQSAKNLRGAKMEDVIFSGTENRKPQGSAYVAITLDNSDHHLPIDYNEVTVARRVYRSGESEYLINGNVSRLKDVNRLFFDTGIGKEGYSIIGQGKIEQILSGKPDDRRELFDEAAGIVKYKKNKIATEKQLEQEHINLNRINDIVRGLEERIEPLREQSETARQYLLLKEELKKLEVGSFLMEIKSIEDKIEQDQKKYDIVNDDKARLEKEFEDTKSRYEELEESMATLDRTMEEIKELINARNLENERAEGKINVFNERIASADQNRKSVILEIERVEKEKNRLAKDLAEKENSKKEIGEKLKAEADKEAKLKVKADKFEKELNTTETDIDKAKGDIIDFLNEGGEIKEKVARYDAMLESIGLRKTELQSIFLQNKSDEVRETNEKEKLTINLKSVEESVSDNKKKLGKAEADLREKTEKYDKIKTDIQRFNQDIISLKSKYESLRNLTERYEGYGVSIKKVMEKKQSAKGIVGVVADIIKVDQDYETAVETALGGSIQNIVTKDDKTAKDMIFYLKQNKLGRATFLPVSSVVGRGHVDKEVLDESGIIGIASQLVKTEDTYRNIIESLLGRTVVAKDIDTATRVAKKYHQSLRIVTLEGELISPGGSMTGGAFRNKSNLLGRNRELEEIQKEIGEVSRKYQKAKEEEASLKMKRDSLKEEIERINSALHKLSIEKNTVTLGLSSVEEKLAAIQTSFARIKKENEELETQTKDITQNKEELYDSEKQQEKAIEERKKAIEKLEKTLDAKRTEKRSIDDEISGVVLRSSSIKQELSYAENDISRINGDIERYELEKKGYEERLGSQDKEEKQLSKDIEETRKNIELNNRIIKERSEKLDELSAKKKKINEEHKDFIGRREELSKEINGLDKSSFTLAAAIEKQQEKKDELLNYMWDEYELTESSAEELNVKLDKTLPETKKEIGGVRSKIKALGDVNVKSIEEYKEVSERYEFLSGQRDDIVKSEENLRDIIAGLDKAMKDTFTEKFAEIQNMFSKVFKELFGGGKASLSLVDEEDILETGIIINAQPPGKKLQNMMQLSGGEKSLTAIALLFAIQSLKPSPFCLLDEIEAALDDPNVKRFAKYLGRLTKDTQFIVITHRKGTMECADVLYGITMQEKGVSTQVSVSMIEEGLAG